MLWPSRRTLNISFLSVPGRRAPEHLVISRTLTQNPTTAFWGAVWLWGSINHTLVPQRGLSGWSHPVQGSALCRSSHTASVEKHQLRALQMHCLFQKVLLFSRQLPVQQSELGTYTGKGQKRFFFFSLAHECHKKSSFSNRRVPSSPFRAGGQGKACQDEAVGFKRSKQSWHGHTHRRHLETKQCGPDCSFSC